MRSDREEALKRIPKFESEEQERAFWEDSANDSTEYVDWSKASFTDLVERPASEPEVSPPLL